MYDRYLRSLFFSKHEEHISGVGMYLQVVQSDGFHVHVESSISRKLISWLNQPILRLHCWQKCWVMERFELIKHAYTLHPSSPPAILFKDQIFLPMTQRSMYAGQELKTPYDTYIIYIYIICIYIYMYRYIYTHT